MEIQLPQSNSPTQEERDALEAAIQETLQFENDDLQRMRDVLSAVSAIFYLLKHPQP